MSVEYITQKGAQLVKKFGTRDPFKIAEGLGIKVMFVDDFKNRDRRKFCVKAE